MSITRIDFASLCRVQSTDEIEAAMLSRLAGAGFTVTSWQPGGFGRTFIRITATLASGVTTTIAELAKGAYNATAEGTFLDLLSEDWFGNERQTGRAARGVVVLKSAPTASTITINLADNQLIVQDPATGVTFKNTQVKTLAPGASVQIEVQATVVGVRGNSAVDAITVLKSAWAGVTVSNPPLTDSSGVVHAGWLVQAGADPEDDERLRRRNSLKMTEWAAAPVQGTYESIALRASPTVTRVSVDPNDPRGKGSVDVYLAGADGAVDVSVCVEVERALRGLRPPDYTINRVPPGGRLRVVTAKERSIVVNCTVYHTRETTAAVEEPVLLALAEYARRLPIGGERIDSRGRRGVTQAGVVHTIMSVAGVTNVVLADVLSEHDIEMLTNEVARLFVVPRFTNPSAM